MAKPKKIRVLLFVLILSWMTFIFIMSAQTASDSSNLSGGIVSKIIAAFFKDFDFISLQKQQKITDIITFAVRKSAHFSEYFILGLLCGLLALTYNRFKHRFSLPLAFAFCTIYALSDEIHQYFVPGRACRLLDVCIDAAGSAAAIALTAIIYCKKRHKFGEFNA